MYSILFFSFFFVFVENKLISVTIVERHGDREPLMQLPTFPPFQNMGELTTIGRQHLRNIGKNIGARYQNSEFSLSNTYDEDYFSFFATDSMRTKQSLLSFLEGFFPGTGQVYNGEAIFPDNRTAVALKSVLESDDHIFLSYEKCPNSLNVENSRFASNVWSDYIESNRPVLTRLLGQVGLTEEDVNYYKDWNIISVIDALYCLHNHNISILPITEDEYNEYIQIFDKLSLLEMPYDDVVGGKTFCDVNTAMIAKMFAADWNESSSASTPVRYRHYLAHDVNLIIFGGCWGVPALDRNPGYGGMLVVEAYDDLGGAAGTGTGAYRDVRLKFLWDYHPTPAGDLALEEFTPVFCAGDAVCTLQSFATYYAAILGQPTEAYYTDTCGLAAPLNVTLPGEKVRAATGQIVGVCVAVGAFAVFTVLAIALITILLRGKVRGWSPEDGGVENYVKMRGKE